MSRVVFLHCITIMFLPLFSAGVSAHAAEVSRTPPRFGRKVQALLRPPPDDRSGLAFVAALSAIARDDGWDRHDYDSPKVAGVAEGDAVAVDYRGESYVVVILHWPGLVMPGPDSYELMLLDRAGHRLDRLRCEVSSRVTLESSFRVDSPKSPEKDGAQFVIRCVPPMGDKMPANFGHTIYYRGRATTFGWDQDVSRQGKPVAWSRTGLCRIAVQDGKFKVIFPLLGQSPGKQGQ